MQLPLIIQKRIRKASNAYFCLTNNKNLPIKNYKINFSEKYQSFIIENFGFDSYISKNSCNYLDKLIKTLDFKDFIFLDIGAGDINTKFTLGSVTLLGEYLMPLRPFAPADLSFYKEGATPTGADPKAMHFEAQYKIHMDNKQKCHQY